jgi:serine/threonine-protein kinase
VGGRERDRVRRTYARALERLAEQAGAAGRWADAAAAAEQLSALDPLDPEPVARLAEARRRAGDPAGALDRLDALDARRRAELGAGLPPRLTALREALRAEVAAREAERARAALRGVGAGDAPRPAVPPALVGRDAERGRLLAAWRHVADGVEPVLLTGPSGAGRTRLLDALLAAARAEGAVVLAARGYAADRDLPWETARPLLAPLAEAPGLAALAPAALARVASVVPAVRDAFPRLAESPAGDERAALEALRQAVEEVAAEVPVVLAVDDLPLADGATRRLVLTLARRLPRPGLLLVLTAADDALAAMPEGPALLDLPALARLPLAPLDAAGAESLVGGMLPLGDDDRRAVAARLLAEHGGTPGALVAGVGALVAAGELAPDGANGWRLAPRPAPRAAPRPSTRPVAPARSARRRRAAGAAAVLALAGGAWVAARGVGAARAPGLDASLVAVAPFDVADPDLALWREGVVDVLARALDGAGPLRTVAPTVVVRRFEGRGDRVAAAQLGARTGAGLVVYGGLVRAGADSVRLEATLYDARRDRPVGEVRVVESAARMDRALDSLGVALLRVVARTRPLGAVRAAGIASASLPALKAFLSAEQHYRAGAYDSALAAAERALQLDGDFALARHRAGTLQLRGSAFHAGAAALMRAAWGTRGLAPRDSLVLALDSLRAAGELATERGRDLAVPAPLAEALLARARQATRLYPDDPELWYAFAEALTHLGAFERATHEDQLAAYERAIALDSAFLPSYPHAVGANLALGRVARARRHLHTARALARGTRLRDAAALLARVVRDDATVDTTALAAWLAGAPFEALEPVGLMLDDWPDSTGAMLRVLRRAERAAGPARPEVVRWFVQPMIRATLERQGRLAERRALDAPPAVVVEHALLGGVSREAGDAAARAWLAGDAAALTRPQPLVWLAERGDSAALRRYGARLDAALPALPAADTVLRRRAAHAARLGRAYLRLAARDTAGALAQLARLEVRDCPTLCVANDLFRARLMAAAGDAAGARALLGAGSPAEGEVAPGAFDVLWQLERARAAERAGDRPRAAAAYAAVAGFWAHADAPLRPLAREAQAGARRLGGRAAGAGGS